MKKISAKRNGTRVVFQCRLSYVHLDAPWAGKEGQEKKYSVCALVPKEDKETVEAIKEAIEEAVRQGVVSLWKGSRPKKISSPLHDGDEEREGEEYEGMMYLSANSKKAVPVLNALKEDIDPNEAYSGCYGLVSVNFFPYDANGNRGAGAGLNAVLKLAEGERLGGGGDGRRDFDEMDLGVGEDLEDL